MYWSFWRTGCARGKVDANGMTGGQLFKVNIWYSTIRITTMLQKSFKEDTVNIHIGINDENIS